MVRGQQSRRAHGDEERSMSHKSQDACSGLVGKHARVVTTEGREVVGPGYSTRQ
jgi:hypothetical protein